jgi:hypothetical protein
MVACYAHRELLESKGYILSLGKGIIHFSQEGHIEAF